MNTQDFYNLLLAVHEKQGKLDEHMNALDSDIGALAHDVRKIDIALRGNGSPGALTRISMLENELEAVAPQALVQRLEARLSEHCRSDATDVTRGGHRLHFWGTFGAAAVAALAALAVACMQLI